MFRDDVVPGCVGCTLLSEQCSVLSPPRSVFKIIDNGPFPRSSFGRQRGPRRTKNLVHQLSVSLEDMYNGTVRKLALQKNVICDGCEGIGGKPGAVQKCPNCRGTGMQVC